MDLLSQFPTQTEQEGILLEIGCGGGEQCLFLTRLCLGYIGIDYSFEKVAYSKRRCAEWSLIAGDGLNLPIKEESVDRILMRDVLPLGLISGRIGLRRIEVAQGR